ncbi:MAG: MBL fold metallo-hydrolase [Saprospiraceae bacterium]|nr:MBL fold metallo-hydrolase [Saprospiraceae bacterium]
MIYYLLGLLILLVLAIFILGRNQQFGGRISKREAEKFQKSIHWDGQKFNNLEETDMSMSLSSFPRLIREQLQGRKERSPSKAIPVQPFDLAAFNRKDPGGPKFIWYGHSAMLLTIVDQVFLIDPMLGPNASPIAPVATPRFSEDTLEIIDTLPKLNAVLLTHDHYDHLDLASITKLKGKTDHFLVALGMSRHLERWGISPDKITEFDWWEEIDFNGIRIIFTPSRHFSGRGLRDRAKSLWGGWIFLEEEYRIYWTGDGGYGNHFQEIGKRFGPFDWVFSECGQYNELWHLLHMYPEESVQAVIDAGGKIGIPVHWGGFTLALHHWTDPINRFVRTAGEKGQKIYCPRPGELVTYGTSVQNEWWTDYR